jgi:hypothetical protein
MAFAMKTDFEDVEFRLHYPAVTFSKLARQFSTFDHIIQFLKKMEKASENAYSVYATDQSEQGWTNILIALLVVALTLGKFIFDNSFHNKHMLSLSFKILLLPQLYSYSLEESISHAAEFV